MIPKISKRGYLILDVLIAITLLTIIVVSVFPSLNFMLMRSRRSVLDAQAGLIAQTAIEAVYHIFLNDWNAYPSNAFYKLVPDLSLPAGPKWALSPVLPTEFHLIQAKYKRIIEIKDVSRNSATGEQGAGEIDYNSRKIVTTVSWDEAGIEKSLKAELLLVNLK